MKGLQGCRAQWVKGRHQKSIQADRFLEQNISLISSKFRISLMMAMLQWPISAKHGAYV